jgi:ribosomal-protein-alanine N-acetyltransferase
MSVATKIQVRLMLRRDMPQVLAIESCNTETRFSEAIIKECLDKPNHSVLVGEIDNTIHGYMIYELCDTSFELITLAIAPQFRRQGYGTMMIDKMKRKLRLEVRSEIICELRESNLDGQLFLKKCGFVCHLPVKRNAFKDYYEGSKIPGRVEDAYKFVYDLKDH